MSTDKATTAPRAKTPSSPGDSSSTTSWPATEIAVSEQGDSATATPSSPVDSPSPRADQAAAQPADAARSLEASVNEDGSPDIADRELKTPASPTWSRSKVPVSDDERDAGGAKSLDSNTGDVADKEDKQSIDAAQQSDSSKPAKSGAARPAFVVTRPTAMGENEVVSVTQPSTPSASVHEGDEPVADPALKAVEVALKPASSTDSSLKPIIQITTFLPETQSFVASPASTSLPSAISPRTSAFFSSDFSMSGPRSPPRPGGAIIMELPSDVELDVDIEVRRATRTVVSSTNESASASMPAPPRRTSPATSTKHRSRSPSPQPPLARGDKRSTSSNDRRLRSRHRHDANLSDADSSASEPDAADAARVAFLPRRTVVSSAAPFLSRTESLREQARRREQDEGREREREEVRARCEGPRDGQQRSHDDRRRDEEREERRRAEHRAETRRHGVEPARREREREHEPVNARRFDDARHSDYGKPDRHGAHRRDAARAEQPRKPALARLLDAVQQALDHDPAAYYALKGLLAEHEHAHARSGRQHERARERDAAEPGERRRERDEGHGSARDGLAKDEQRSYERERREKRIPVDLLGRGERDSGSETEVGFEKVKRGGGLKSSHFDTSLADKLRTPRFFSSDPPDSPSPPSYPSHLSPQRTSRTHLPAPEPARPHDDSTRRAPRPAQTLTLAQAAKLAAGLGDERLAEELRASGLSGRDKVTKLGERVGERVEGSQRRAHEHVERERRRDEGRWSGKVQSGKASRKGGVDEELKQRRRQGDERGESSSSSPHGPSAKDALRSSIFKVRPPVVDDDLPVAAVAGSRKASRRRRDNDEPYRSPTTGSAARAASHFDLPTRLTGGGPLSYDFDDYA